MNVYTYSEARQKLARVLEQAAREGEARIRRKDGQLFVIQLIESPSSPLDVEGLDLGLGADEIVRMVREGRRTGYRGAPDWRAPDWRAYVDTEGGEATIHGTEIAVATILDDLADGPGPDELARRDPTLTREAVQAALQYAAEQVRTASRRAQPPH